MAGVHHFGLYHQLTAMNIKCQVITPSRIPKSLTDRIKNDHRDVISLANLLRAGELTPVWIPDLTHEAMRDLIRARAAAKRDSRVARQRILSMLLRTDKRYAGKHWTGKHRTWLLNWVIFHDFPIPDSSWLFWDWFQGNIPVETANGDVYFTKPSGLIVHHAKVGTWLIYYRPDSVTQYSKDIVWKAQQRLCSCYRSLTAKGKNHKLPLLRWHVS
ncbi:transposase, IS110 family protein [Escherichia coli]|nr:transposase, IS110 family protein [Escherichia coli]